MTRILLVDDHDLFRQSLAMCLNTQDDFLVVGETSDGACASDLAAERDAEVVLLDLWMPSVDGLVACSDIIKRCPYTKVCILTVAEDVLYAKQLLKHGAHAYLLKTLSLPLLYDQIRSVIKGECVIHPTIASKLAMSHIQGTSDNPFDDLSFRELQVVSMLVRGLDSDLIADILKVSKKTIHTYRYRMFDKLNVKHDVQLVTLAMKHGLVPAGPQLPLLSS